MVGASDYGSQAALQILEWLNRRSNAPGLAATSSQDLKLVVAPTFPDPQAHQASCRSGMPRSSATSERLASSGAFLDDVVKVRSWWFYLADMSERFQSRNPGNPSGLMRDVC